MKIAYIVDWNINGNSGVLNKVAAIISFWESQGHEVYLCIVSGNTQKQFIPKNLQHVKVFEQPKMKWLFISGIKRYVGRTSAFNSLYKYLSTLSLEVIYFRQTRWYYPLEKLFKTIPTVMEVNSDDMSERKLTGSKVNQLITTYGHNRIVNKVKGIVFVTQELSLLYKRPGLKTIVISNGIKTNEKPEEYTKQPTPQLIFVGTPDQQWHGLEKIYEMAKELPAFTFHIVGPAKLQNQQEGNIVFHGYLNTKALNELYQIIDIGIGTLSLYIKNMSEACPLKVREYLSYGIPVIVGYKDVDVDGEDFTLNIGNYENNVKDNIDNIRRFAKRFHGKRPDKKLINPLINLETKEKKRLAFLDQFAPAK